MKVIITTIAIIFLLGCNEEIKIVSESKFNTAFNPIEWKKGNLYVRGKMTKDLVNSNILKNISKDSLLSILGEPTENGKYFCNYLVSARDTSISQNYLLIHISLDSISHNIKDYWVSD
jgi:hypothetical protein